MRTRGTSMVPKFIRYLALYCPKLVTIWCQPPIRTLTLAPPGTSLKPAEFLAIRARSTRAYGALQIRPAACVVISHKLCECGRPNRPKGGPISHRNCGSVPLQFDPLLPIKLNLPPVTGIDQGAEAPVS
jgi:hypothetical protein